MVSHAGAVGVMQLMPATADWVGDAMLGTRVEIGELRHNVRAGVRLLAHYLGHYKGDRDRVLAAYYQGQWAVDHHGIYAVSRPYIASISACWCASSAVDPTYRAPMSAIRRSRQRPGIRPGSGLTLTRSIRSPRWLTRVAVANPATRATGTPDALGGDRFGADAGA